MQKRAEKDLAAVLACIEQADDLEMEEIMGAVRRRFASAFPEWEVIYMAIHREPALRERDIADILTMLGR